MWGSLCCSNTQPRCISCFQPHPSSPSPEGISVRDPTVKNPPSFSGLHFSYFCSSKSVTTDFPASKIFWTCHLFLYPVQFVLVPRCFCGCCNFSTLILRLGEGGGNRCTCLQCRYPTTQRCENVDEYLRGGALEAAGSRPGLAWMPQQPLVLRGLRMLARCLHSVQSCGEQRRILSLRVLRPVMLLQRAAEGRSIELGKENQARLCYRKGAGPGAGLPGADL